MANIAIFNPGATPQPVLQYLTSVSSPDYALRSDVVINPDLSAVTGLALRYWKHVSGAILAMTAQEQAAVDAAIAAAVIAGMHSGGTLQLAAQDSVGVLQRAFADIVKDELNILRQWTISFKVAVAASTSLANLQTRVAALPDLSDRTLAQLKTAIESRISGGTVD